MLPSRSCCSVSSQTGEAFNVTLSNSGDTIVTVDGADTITGGAGADSIKAGDGADDITGNGGRDAFIQAAGASGLTAATVDQISDFGKVTVAATGAEVTAMNSVANFQAAATARGGDNTDIIDFQALILVKYLTRRQAMSTSQAIRERIAAQAAGELFTPALFAGLGSRASIVRACPLFARVH